MEEIVEKIISVIKTIYDPEIPVNIYELGLIYDVSIIEKDVRISMTLTSPNCPVAESLPKEVEDKVGEVHGVDRDAAGPRRQRRHDKGSQNQSQEGMQSQQ